MMEFRTDQPVEVIIRIEQERKIISVVVGRNHKRDMTERGVPAFMMGS